MKLIITLSAVLAIAMSNNVEDTFRKATDDFSARFFYEVAKSKPSQSIITSAYSVETPLAQLSLASVGPSHDEILTTLGLPDEKTIKEIYPTVNNKILNIKGVTLKAASRIYVNKEFELNDDFATESRKLFNSDVKSVDFTDETVNEINAWVEDQTNHKIKDLVKKGELDSDTTTVLVNALYFKGNWKDKFNKNQTTDRDFHVTKDRTVKVPTMYKKAEFKYGESPELNAKILEIPYEKEEASFVVVLPNEVDGIGQLQEKLRNSDALNRALTHTYSTEVEVYLPKFKIETTTNLKDILEKLNIKKIFGNDAGLEKLIKGTGSLKIGDARQKAFIEVNEDGAEAAAANKIVLLTRSSFHRHRVFDVNRPFIFILRHRGCEMFKGVFMQ